MKISSHTRPPEHAKTKAAAFDALPFQVALIDWEGVILAVNESWRTQGNGSQPAGFGVGQNYLDSYDIARKAGLDKATEVVAGIQQVLLGELREFAIEYPSGGPARPQWLRITVTPVESSPSQGAMILHVDISLQKIAEQSLREQESQYLLLLNSTREGIFTVEQKGICTFCNRAGARLLGYEKPSDVVGKVIDHRHHRSQADSTPRAFVESKINQAMVEGSVLHADDEFLYRADGTQFPVEYWSHPILHDGAVVGTVVTFLDITDQLRLKSEFLHSQKMEVVGRLAGGVAHDFKNALAVIIGYSQLLEERMSTDEGGRRYVTQIGVAAERAASFARQLLGLNQKRSLHPVLLDLNITVKGMEEMLRRVIGEDLILTTVLAPRLSPIKADPGQIEQVLLNLIVNAKDAMPQGGELVIQTSSADGYVTLSINDNGCGMDQATQDRIFEPFFTTKAPGKGTGLGLSMVRSIVTENGGHIFVHSEVGVGTSFQICLPISSGVPGPILLSQMPPRALRGAEVILVVEDDEALRTLVVASLRENGYRVLEAGDGKSGIEIAEQCGHPVDLVIADVVLPILNGGHLVKRLIDSNRSLEVLYMSGYTDEYIASLGVVIARTQILDKPFDLGLMLTSVRKALDRAAARNNSVGHSGHLSDLDQNGCQSPSIDKPA